VPFASSCAERPASPGLLLMVTILLLGCRANDRGLRPGAMPRPAPRVPAGVVPPRSTPPPSTPAAVDASVGGEDPIVVADDAAPPAAPTPATDGAAADVAPLPDAASDPPPPSADLARGLAVYLPFDEGIGSTLRDFSGLGQIARLAGADPSASWSDGAFGSALTLAGGPAGGYVVVDSSPSLISARTALSISAWLLLPPDGGDGVIASRRATGTGGYLFSVRVVKNRLNCLINSANGYRADATSTTPVPRGRWTHLAMTFDSADRARLYIDGKPAGAMEYLLAIPPETTPIVIGGAETETANGNPSGVTGRLAARLDEFALHDRALTPGEVAQLADRVRPRVR
jgi:hypothetical protein